MFATACRHDFWILSHRFSRYDVRRRGKFGHCIAVTAEKLLTIKPNLQLGAAHNRLTRRRALADMPRGWYKRL
jgi:hypothetical protein